MDANRGQRLFLLHASFNPRARDGRELMTLKEQLKT